MLNPFFASNISSCRCTSLSSVISTSFLVSSSILILSIVAKQQYDEDSLRKNNLAPTDRFISLTLALATLILSSHCLMFPISLAFPIKVCRSIILEVTNSANDLHKASTNSPNSSSYLVPTVCIRSISRGSSYSSCQDKPKG